MPIATKPSGRITPAYAGKRSTLFQQFHTEKDHPRLCGEKAKKARQTPEDRGSPPPMRGKGSRITKASVRIGITPAYAGKSAAYEQRCRTLEDHPRLCGEKLWKLTERNWSGGSPPPMRGKDLRSCHEGGKSPDHPRLCGEKFLFACRGTSTKGSPPPMRGKVVNVIRVVPKSRITPAYAGKRCNSTKLLH